MGPSFARVCAVLALGLTACTLDSTNPTGSGGSTSTGSTSSEAGSTSAASGTGGAGTSSTSGSTAAATTTTTASSSSAASSSSSSSSSGGGTIAFCSPTVDDFDLYATDATFKLTGELMGPWEEDPPNTDNVSYVVGGRIKTTYGGGSGAFLQLKALVSATAPCAMTIRLASTSGGRSAFGIWDQASDFTELTCFETNNVCQPLRAFGIDGGTIPLVNGGLYLGIVARNDRLFGLYSGDGTSWTLIPNQGQNGVDGQAYLDQPFTTYFGQNPNSDESVWDEFNVHAIPKSAVP